MHNRSGGFRSIGASGQGNYDAFERIKIIIKNMGEYTLHDGEPIELIMKIGGNKRTKDFYKYIRITPEEAANKIKELWLARDDMKLIKETVEKMGVAI